MSPSYSHLVVLNVSVVVVLHSTVDSRNLRQGHVVYVVDSACGEEHCVGGLHVG